MKTKFWLLALVLAMLVPEAAWGQSSQAVPTYAANDMSVLMVTVTDSVIDATIPDGYSTVFDISRYSALTFTLNLSGGCTAGDWATLNVAASPNGTMAKDYEPPNGRLTKFGGGSSATGMLTVGSLSKFVRVHLRVSKGVGLNPCTAVVYMAPRAFAEAVTVSGPYLAGTAPDPDIMAPVPTGAIGYSGASMYSGFVSLQAHAGTNPGVGVLSLGNLIVEGPLGEGVAPGATSDWPLMCGGKDDTTKHRTFRTDASGNLYTALATTGGSTETYSEMLVASAAATAVPTSATARSTTIQNIGPNPIYCGFTNAVTTLTGLKIDSGQGATFDTAAQPAMYCIGTVLQVAGAGTRVVLSDVPDTVRFYGGGGGGGAAGAMTPSVATNVALSANVSNTACALTSDAYYRLSCDAAANYRIGAATPTAVSTDSLLPTNTLLDIKLGSPATCVAFVSGSATNCRVGLLTP